MAKIQTIKKIYITLQKCYNHIKKRMFKLLNKILSIPIFNNFKDQLLLEKAFLREIVKFWILLRKYNASSHTDDDIEKMQYTLLRENHTIEKGMSMRNPKRGFGQQKVMHLLERLNVYADCYYKKDPAFLNYPLSTIYNYIHYTKSCGIDIDEIERQFYLLLNKTHNENITGHVCVYTESKNHILENCNKDFKSIIFSRHSIRYFKKEIPKIETIEQALKIAQQTPSACNRQGWHTHIYDEKKSLELLKWQGGCRGFEDEIKCTILVTANLKAFLSYEVHQAYVDGGLYAMNLINALHSLGLGTIPLSVAFECTKLEGLKYLGIPQNEVPIVIVGIGEMMDEFNVAVSQRKDIEKTTTWH